jgi:hypothetical protein
VPESGSLGSARGGGQQWSSLPRTPSGLGVVSRPFAGASCNDQDAYYLLEETEMTQEYRSGAPVETMRRPTRLA